jgi:hypothetical protein
VKQMKFHCNSIAGPLFAAAIFLAGLFPGPARAQMEAGQSLASVGYCQTPAASLASAVDLSACVAASFTATCAGTTLTASSVTGAIDVGWKPAGTGIVAGTTIAAQLTGTPGGAGTYRVSAACTSSAASLTTVGPPINANAMLMQAETQNIRWRDDGANPTTTVGMLLVSGQPPVMFTGQLSAIRFIDAVANGILNVAFYRSGSP